MLTKTEISPANLNALAKLVSNASFQRIIFEDDFKVYGRQMKSLLKKSGANVPNNCSFQQIIDISYHYLSANYRHEYLYKTALLNSYILKQHCLSDTVLLNEFKIGNSKADLVLVNGRNKVFEIKTELDSPERLSSQLNDYYKAFSEVHLVLHHSLVNKYIKLIDDHVGIMTFNDNTIQVYRDAKADDAKLDIAVMMKTLRKDEYLLVVRNLCGAVPSTTPILLFKACLNSLANFAADEVQAEFLKVLKNRINPITNSIITESSIPDVVRFSCYHSNLKQNDYIGLIKRLNYRF